MHALATTFLIVFEAVLAICAASALITHRAATGVWFVATGAAMLVVFVFSPGLMSFDSLRQYAQATGREPLNNFHPVVMTYLWGGLMDLLHYPGAMLFFNQTVHWSAAAIISVAIARNAWVRLLLLGIFGLWPPTAILSLHIWKDVGMGETLALSVGLMAIHARVKSPWLPAAALGTLVLATLFRHNAIVATLPLAGFACFQLATYVRPFRKRIVALLLVCWAAAFGLVSYGLDAPALKANPLPTLLLWDIAAISLAENEPLFPAYYEPLVEGNLLAAVRDAYSPDTNHTIYTVISPYPEGIGNVQMARDWLMIVAAHPVAYIKHRMHVVATMLGLRQKVYYPFHWGIDENDFGLTTDSRTPDEMWLILTVFDQIARWPTHRLWIYVLALIAAMAFSTWRLARSSRTERDGLIFIISASGLLVMVSMLVVTVAADYRYANWVIMSAVISVALVASSVFRVARSDEESKASHGRPHERQ